MSAGHPLVVVGDALLDRDVHGAAERLAPDAPVPVLDEHSVAARPGGAAFAAALAALDGLEVTLVPMVDGADVAVNLHGRGPQSHRILLASEPRSVIAFRNDAVPTLDGPEWRAGEHEVTRWCRLLGESGIPADPRRLAIDPPDEQAPPVAAGATLLHPGAASGGRRWPVARWAEVARHEQAAGRRVVVTGSAAERPLAQAVASGAGLAAGCVLAGRTDVIGLAAAVAGAGRVACGDTGVAHLATALDRPSVVLFGPTPPHEWGPPRGRRHRVLWAGRRGDPHAGTPGPGLLSIDSAAVIHELSRLSAAEA